MSDLAENLFSARKARGWTQATLARVSGLSTSYISELETQVRFNPYLNTLLALSSALGVTISELAGEVPMRSTRRQIREPLTKLRQKIKRQLDAVGGES